MKNTTTTQLCKLMDYLNNTLNVNFNDELVVFGYPLTNDTSEQLPLFPLIYINNKVNVSVTHLTNNSVGCYVKCMSNESNILKFTDIKVQLPFNQFCFTESETNNSTYATHHVFYTLQPFAAIANTKANKSIVRELTTGIEGNYHASILRLIEFINNRLKYLPKSMCLNTNIFNVIDLRKICTSVNLNDITGDVCVVTK